MTNSDNLINEETNALDLYYDGWQAYNEGDYSLAYTFFVESATMQSHFKTYEVLYSLLTKLNRLDEAFSHIEKAFSLNPKNNRTATFYAEELFKRNKVYESQQILLDILKGSNNYGPAKRLLVRIEADID